ncbi:MAG: acyl-CoA/acyl-ACP dehydrogenase [Anaerolineae bacterium]|jgi:alkylation response protein AidB-like acyl-CoA dehydrogenase|nr:acyl-CoA/acyl-ACP dehydrogenase [Anaerolineae bacterium]MDH7472889.1 acyl-CoA dehydrogenase family protein [Anaerolineae bacterium]
MIEALLTEAQRELRNEVRDFVRNVPRQLVLDMDADKVRYPREYVRQAARRHLLGLRFPVEYGGRGLKWEDEIIALEEVGVLGTALGCAYAMPSIVGEALNVFGTAEQKERWLRPLLSGELISAEALTEPRGGSDFFGTTTLARRAGDGYVLNGQKRFIVGAAEADFFLVYARTNPEAPPHESISAFIVERGPGVEVEHLYGLMGTRGGGTGRLVFREAHVPLANLIGREHGAADIFYQMMIPERMTSAAAAMGMARAALEIAARYSDRRHAFGQKIRRFEGVSFKVADSITLLDAAYGLVHGAACSIDNGDDPNRVRRLVHEAKKFATDAAWQVINHAMQIMGGIGYTNVYPIERLLRDARLIMIWTGTNEVMDLVIQHEYYREILSARPDLRDVEADAVNAEAEEEKVYE